MSVQELEVVRGLLRETEIGLAGPVGAARENFDAMLSNIPVDDDVAFEPAEVGGVPGQWSSTPATASSERVLLYLHGGCFNIGSTTGYRALWSAFAKGAGARGLALDYRLAPEHAFPAAVDDAVAAYRALLDAGHAPRSVAFAGDSAGGGLVFSALLGARDAGLPMPAGALALSPMTDLTLSGESLETKADADLSLSYDDLAIPAGRYLDGADPAQPLASPVFADLTGLPPVTIHVGSAERLLDDSTRIAAKLGADGVRVNLEVWPGMPHVWHSFAFMLSEGAAATARACAFLEDCYEGRAA
ncbi:MAG TPA: alpha/beta hydrolase [Solirubrobacteraceae bacterium]|nr:alpha/beta hydrolase [Solirubrobacteraceae bacterium]